MLELYGEIVRNCENTKIKNTDLRHHFNVKLEIDSMDLNDCQDT